MINKLMKIILFPAMALGLPSNAAIVELTKNNSHNRKHFNFNNNELKLLNNDDIYSDIAFEEFVEWENENKSDILVELYKKIDPTNSSIYNIDYVLELNDNYSKDFITKMTAYNRRNQSINLNISLRDWKSLDLKMLSFLKLMTNIENISFNFTGSSNSSGDRTYRMSESLSISWLSSFKNLKYLKFSSNEFSDDFPYDVIPNILNNNKELSHFDISKLHLKDVDYLDVDKYFSDTNIDFSLYLPKSFKSKYDQENWNIKNNVTEDILIKKVRRPIPLPSNSDIQITIDGNVIKTRIYDSSSLWDISIEKLLNVKYYNATKVEYFTEIPEGAIDKSEYVGVSRITIPPEYKENYEKLTTNSFIIPKKTFEKDVSPSLTNAEIESIISNDIYIDGKNYKVKISKSKFLYNYDFQANKIRYYSLNMKAFWTSFDQISFNDLSKYRIFEANDVNYEVTKFVKGQIPHPTAEGQTITVDGRYEVPSIYLDDIKSFVWGYSLVGIDPKKLKLYAKDNDRLFAFTNFKYITDRDKELYPKLESFSVSADEDFEVEEDAKYNILEIFNEEGVAEYISSKKNVTVNIDDVVYGYRLYNGNVYIDYEDIQNVKYLVYDKNDPDDKEKWKYKTKIHGVALGNNEALKIIKPNNPRQLPASPLIRNPLLSSSEGNSLTVDNNVIFPEISDDIIYWNFGIIGISPSDIKYRDSNNRYYTSELFDFKDQNIPSGLTRVDTSRLTYIEDPKIKTSKILVNYVSFKNLLNLMSNKKIIVDGTQYILQMVNGEIYWINKSNDDELLPLDEIKYIIYDDVEDKDTGSYFTSIENAFKFQENFPIGLTKMQKIDFDLNDFVGGGIKIKKPTVTDEELNIISNNGDIITIKSILSTRPSGEIVVEWDSAFKDVIENLQYVIETPEGKDYYFASLNMTIKQLRELSYTWSNDQKDDYLVNVSNIVNYELEDVKAEYGELEIRKYDINEKNRSVWIFVSIMSSIATIFILSTILIIIKRGRRWK